MSGLPDNVYRFQGRAQVGNAGAWIYDRVAESIEPRPLDIPLRRELRARVLARFAGRHQGMVTVRGADGEWRALAPGVTLKLLRGDPGCGTMTAFIRMLPGSSLGPHEHTQTEECLVMEGEIRIGGHRVAAGDMHMAQPGTTHEPITSPRGALMLVRAEFRAV